MVDYSHPGIRNQRYTDGVQFRTIIWNASTSSVVVTSSFDPSNLFGLKNMTEWLDETSFTSSVVFWTDKSPSKNHMTRSTGAGFSTKTINGLQAFTISGSSMIHYKSSASKNIISASQFHGFAVVNISQINGTSAPTTTYQNEAVMGDNSQGYWGLRYRNSSGVLWVDCQTFSNVNNFNSSGSVPALSQSFLVECWLTTLTTSTRIANGTTQNQIMDLQIGSIVAPTLPSIGNAQGSSTLMSGSICEQIWFCETLSGSDVTNLRQYLGNKWNVTF